MPTRERPTTESLTESVPTIEADDTVSVSCDHRATLRRSRDVSLLLIAVAVLVLSFTLRVRADQRVELLGLSHFPAPETCGSRLWFGIECPGCGAKLSNTHSDPGMKIRCLNCGARFTTGGDAGAGSILEIEAPVKVKASREPRAAGYWLLRIPVIIYAAGMTFGFIFAVCAMACEYFYDVMRGSIGGRWEVSMGVNL